MVVVSHSSFFCSIVVDEIANVIEMMPSGGRTTPNARGNPNEMLLPAD